MKAARILITGGAGFLGGHMARDFLAAGTPVRLFDREPRPEWACGEGIEYTEGDILDSAALRLAMTGVGGVVHAAFASPRQPVAAIRRVNAEGCRILGDAMLAGGVDRLVLVSSTIVEQQPRAHPFLRDAPLSRLDAYRAARLEAEDIIRSYGDRGLSVAIVRPKTFIGSDRVGAFSLAFAAIRDGRSVPVLGNGRNRCQLLDIRDMAAGIRLLAESRAEGLFYFGASEFGSVEEDLHSLIAHAGTKSRLRFVSGSVARAILRGVELGGMVPLSEWHHCCAKGKDSIVDCTRALTELGWRPLRSNVTALVEAYDWYCRTLETGHDAPSTHLVPISHRLMRALYEAVLR